MSPASPEPVQSRVPRWASPARSAGVTAFGDGLARGVEFAGVLLIFVGLGWLLDRWLGTKPWCMVVLSVFSLVGLFVRMWIGYERQMQAHEAARRERLTVPEPQQHPHGVDR
jgi:F0F1-type ATP synthase assembly protein I